MADNPITNFDARLSLQIDRCHNDLNRLTRLPNTLINRLRRVLVRRQLRRLERRIIHE